MQKITPFLWFDTQAREAAKFYTATFGKGEIKPVTTLEDTPSGTVDVITIELFGQQFTLLSAGPLFKFTPAISFLVGCDSQAEVEKLWGMLIEGGTALMELGEYPFSAKYGWLQDRYGLSWQLMYMGERPAKQKITPTLMFVGEQCGKAEAAINFYTSVFHNSAIGGIMRYTKDQAPEKEGTIAHAGFTLEGQEFAAMDSAQAHKFNFTAAISFVVNCKDQTEVDYFWEKLSADPKAEQCGWLKDQYGVSWQIVPTVLNELLQDNDPEKVKRVTAAMLQMHKFDIAALKQAAEG